MAPKKQPKQAAKANAKAPPPPRPAQPAPHHLHHYGSNKKAVPLYGFDGRLDPADKKLGGGANEGVAKVKDVSRPKASLVGKLVESSAETTREVKIGAFTTVYRSEFVSNQLDVLAGKEMEGLDKKRDKHEVLLFEQHGRSLHEELTDEVDGISADFSCAEQVVFSFSLQAGLQTDEGMIYLQMKIEAMHRDLKSENLLFKEAPSGSTRKKISYTAEEQLRGEHKFTIRISDFGLAQGIRTKNGLGVKELGTSFISTRRHYP